MPRTTVNSQSSGLTLQDNMSTLRTPPASAKTSASSSQNTNMLEPNSTHPAKPATVAIARNTNLTDAQNPDRQNANIPEINPSSLNSANYNNMPAQNGANMISLSERQFFLTIRNHSKSSRTLGVTTFSSCTVRFNGGKMYRRSKTSLQPL